MPPKKGKKRGRSPPSSTSTNPQGNKNKKYNIPSNSTVDPTGNLVVPPAKHNNQRSASTSSMTSVKSASTTSAGQRPNLNQDTTKAKPVFVESSYQILNNILINVQFSAKPTLKIMSSQKTKVMCGNVADKSKLVAKLKSQQISYFTFSEPDQKPSIYVLKDHFYTTCDELLKSLTDAQIPAQKVTFLIDNKNYPSYLVHFERLKVNIHILQHNHKAINNLIVKWERFDRARKRLTQCRNCQRYGHSATNCGEKYRCVKCLNEHLPGQCERKSKDDEGSPKCVNCKKEHAANSRECEEFKKYSDKVQRHRQNRLQTANTFVSSPTAANSASPYLAVPSGSSSFPPLPQINPPKFSRIVSSLPNGSQKIYTQPRSFSVADFGQLQSRLTAIPGIAQTFMRFNEMISELESAESESTRLSVMLKYLLPDNAN